MKVLLTGAFGNVGLSTLKELLNRKHKVTLFDLKTSRNKEIFKEYKNQVAIVWGDIRDFNKVKKAVKEQDAIIHTAAIIPPLADEKPDFAKEVNVGGTKNILKAIQEQERRIKLIYISSIAVYGDRRKNPMIKVIDPPNPSKNDEYAKQKLECENLIVNSEIDWIIFRLTYIVSAAKLNLDPIMFYMPLDTCIEICHTKDVGFALAESVTSQEIIGKILNIGGGKECRIMYRDYIHHMFDLFGLGGDLLPNDAFSENDFHCGFMDTRETQDFLHFQHITLYDYFREVKNKTSIKRFFNKCFPLIIRPIVKKYLIHQSPYLKSKQND
jgi:nucleoside-diphosphate-sugar epimerase